MTSIEMRSLILEALSVEDENDTPRGHTFKMYGYRGCVSDLRAITEYLAIKYGLIEKVSEIPVSAWGVQEQYLFMQRIQVLPKMT